MKRMTVLVILTFISLVICSSSPHAVSLSEQVIQKLKDEGRFDQFVQTMIATHAKGVDSPAPPDKSGMSSALAQNQVFRTMVILVDFPDKPYTSGYVAGSASAFDSILFSQGRNPTGSMREYYFENSYGNFTLQGTVIGWYRAANNAAYYTNNCDGSHGMGSYPHNAQRLVEEAVDLADPDIDYSQYDNNGDGYVDGIFVVHAGTGYEETGNDCEIHSHQWSISARYRDGVRISTYSIEPEESPTSAGLTPIGVFCHEFGHVLGLPDLYDTDYSSEGVGDWELMGSGSYNGRSQTPSGLSGWSKSQLGWLSLTNITSNQTNMPIPALAWNSVAYRLWYHGQTGNQYFVIENRQQMGFDSELPGEGVLIWHIDESVWSNTNEWHPRVFLEQADGKFDLQHGANQGDASDPFPNFGYASHFTDKTIPDSKDYNLVSTEVAAWNITPSDSIMTADFDVFWSRPYLTLTGYTFDDATYGDGDGILEGGETVRLTFSVSNQWREAANAVATLTIDDASLPINNGTVNLGTIASGGSANNNADPFVFQVPVGYAGRIDSFFVEITSNGGENHNLLTFEKNVGMPRVLLVDDDNNDNLEHYYSDPMYVSRMPYGRWDKYSSGSPDSMTLLQYDAVFWFTGDYRANPLMPSDVTAMKGYLNGGGQLFLTGQGVAKQLSTLNPTFLSDYLKTQYLSSTMIPVVDPLAGGSILSGFPYVVIQGYGGANNQTAPDHITVLPGATPEGYYLTTSDRAALSYSGSYKLVFFGFGFEAIIAGDADRADRDSVFNRIMDFFDISGTAGFPSVSALTVGPGTQMNLINHMPQFIWTYHDNDSVPQQAFHVEVGTDADWTVAEMWDWGPIYSADTSVTYAGVPLEDGYTYYARVQVYNGTQWSNWRVCQFRMNALPSVPTDLTPDDMTGVTSLRPLLRGRSASDPDGDALTYSYQVYADSLMTSLVTETNGQPPGGMFSSWVVDVSLTEDQEYFWRVRAFDGHEYGAWSSLASFWVNAVNQPPSAFDLIAPSSDTLILDLLPSFVWSSSPDADRHDTVRYRLLYATDPSFDSVQSISGLSDTTCYLSDSLAFGRTYYWKVEAFDDFGAVTTSNQVSNFQTWLLGDANGNGKINVGDAIFIVSYIFRGGPAPEPIKVGDVNGDCAINVGDAVYLVSYIFRSGPPPNIGCATKAL